MKTGTYFKALKVGNEFKVFFEEFGKKPVKINCMKIDHINSVNLRKRFNAVILKGKMKGEPVYIEKYEYVEKV
jgi:hypothetical protein